MGIASKVIGIDNAMPERNLLSGTGPRRDAPFVYVRTEEERGLINSLGVFDRCWPESRFARGPDAKNKSRNPRFRHGAGGERPRS